MKIHWITSKKVAFIIFLTLILSIPITVYATENVSSSKGLEKLTGAAEQVQGNILEMAQVFSMPLLMISFIGGAVLLVGGILISILSQRLGDIIRGSGMVLMFGGIVAFVLMNIAPNLGEQITNFVSGIFN